MTNQPTMNTARFNEIIDKLGFTQRGASHFLGVTERTMARWIASDHIARPVAMVLELPESGIAPTFKMLRCRMSSSKQRHFVLNGQPDSEREGR
jgi:hypothetical protein